MNSPNKKEFVLILFFAVRSLEQIQIAKINSIFCVRIKFAITI